MSRKPLGRGGDPPLTITTRPRGTVRPFPVVVRLAVEKPGFLGETGFLVPKPYRYALSDAGTPRKRTRPLTCVRGREGCSGVEEYRARAVNRKAGRRLE